ncbi:MAG TPA: glutamine cyclotransferase [Flavobacterium sp.]|nr:glutamine cyclotransferase [Flavobacterium sp.]
MNIYKILCFIMLSILILSCKDDINETKKIFSIDTSKMKQAYTPLEKIEVAVSNPDQKKIDSVVYYLNDIKKEKTIKNGKTSIKLVNQSLGYTKLKAVVFFEGKIDEAETNFTIYALNEPKLLKYKIINSFYHDLNSYTQGYEFYGNILMEGSGQYGKSSLRKTDYKTGKIIEKIDLDNATFGEGITILNDKIYQLTWKENKVYVYNAKNLKLIKTMPYFKKIEGWGLTNDGTYLYMSDGSEKIYKLNPETFEMISYINVYSNANKIEFINELEWINGKIWANIYQKDVIIVIDPKTGSLEYIINLTELKSKVTNTLQDGEVLNGIAYNPISKTILVTGKNWDSSFEIQVE